MREQCTEYPTVWEIEDCYAAGADMMLEARDLLMLIMSAFRPHSVTNPIGPISPPTPVP